MFPITIRRLSFTVSVFVVSQLLGGSALASDVLMLRRGGRIEGRILKRPSGPNGHWIIKVNDGTHLRLRPAEVGRVVELTPAQEKYRRLLAAVPDTERGHAKLAEWCHENRLRSERDFHWEQVLRLDPNHEAARKKLGYRRIRDQWMQPDEYMKQQGYVKFGNAWRTPEQVEIEERKRAYELATKALRKDILLWRSWLNGRRRSEAERRFQELKDPLATSGLREVINEESNDDTRAMLIAALAQIPGAGATEGLIHSALQDGDAEIRLQCIEALGKRADRRTVIDAFVGALRSPSNKMVRRAGVALAYLGDREAILPLIAALETTHVTIEQPREQIRTSFGGAGNGNGLGGLSVGGGPKKVTKHLQNRAVLDALVKITGQNYRYSKSDWKRWFIDEFSLPEDYNLRRGV